MPLLRAQGFVHSSAMGAMSSMALHANSPGPGGPGGLNQPGSSKCLHLVPQPTAAALAVVTAAVGAGVAAGHAQLVMVAGVRG